MLKLDTLIRVPEEINMKLIDISKELETVEDEIQKSLGEYYSNEIAYTLRRNDLLLRSMLSNAPAREAEAYNIVSQEPVFEEYQKAKLTMKKLWSKKETLIELSKNFRALETNVK